MTTYTKFPYRTEFPDSSEGGRNSKTLEDALSWARWHVHRIWRETNEYGREGEYIDDTESGRSWLSLVGSRGRGSSGERVRTRAWLRHHGSASAHLGPASSA